MDTLGTQLANLEQIQLIRMLTESELAYLFKHVLTQETVYKSLLHKRQREIHLNVADCYEHLYADELDAYAAILAHHYFEGGAPAKTFEYALRAGEGAARLYAHDEALMHYARALTALEQLYETPTVPAAAQIQRLYTSRGRTFELTNRYELAEQNALDMEAAARARGNRALELAAMTLRAPLYSTYTPLFDPAKAHTLNTQALALAREIGDRAAEAKLLWVSVLLSNYSGGDPTTAIAQGERSLALARELGLREQTAYSLNDLAFTYGIVGEYDKDRVALLEVAELWKELGNLPMLADATVNLGGVEAFTGNFDAALRAGAEAYRLSQVTGSLWGQAYSQMFMGFVHAIRADYGTAFRVMEETFRLGQAASFVPPEVITRMDYAWALGNLGLLAQAIQEGEHAYRVMTEAIPPFAPLIVPYLVRLYLRAGDRTSAEKVSQGPLGLNSDSPWKHSANSKAPRAMAEAELALAQNDSARALEWLNPISEFLEEHHTRSFLPEVLYLKANALTAQGDAEGALDVLERARREAEQSNMRWILWQILARLSELERTRGNLGSAKKHRDTARQLLQYIAEHIDLSSQRESFLGLEPVKELMSGE
jgi:tetratricopeptide (TPR) repeat protein